MTEYAPCPQCGEVQVPIGDYCFDCWCPVSRDREQYVQSLRASLSRAEMTLRDRCVLAALPVAEVMMRLNYGRFYTKEIVDKAYELADEMLARRARDQEKP